VVKFGRELDQLQNTPESICLPERVPEHRIKVLVLGTIKMILKTNIGQYRFMYDHG